MKQFWKRAAVAIVSLALLAGMPPPPRQEPLRMKWKLHSPP